MLFNGKKLLLLSFLMLYSTSLVYSENSIKFPESGGVTKWINEISSPQYKSLRAASRVSKKEKRNENYYFSNIKLYRNPAENPHEIRLPTDKYRQIDWTSAIRKELLNPLNSIVDLDTEEESETLDNEYIYHNSMHQYWLTCNMCHPEIFPMEKGGTENLTMQNILKGEFCGRCHGKVAFSLRYCKKCHLETESFSFKKPDPEFPIDVYGMIDWVKVVESGMAIPSATFDGSSITEEESEDIKVDFVEGFRESKERTGMSNLGGGIGGTLIFFPHSIHSSRLSCKTCHPKIFAEKKGATKNVGMVGIIEGKSCGKCHGKVAFPINNCARCHPKLKPDH